MPDQVAVIGAHNDELLCELCDPPLSSVVPNARCAGLEAAALLTRRSELLLLLRLFRQPPVQIAVDRALPSGRIQHPRFSSDSWDSILILRTIA